MKKKYLVLGALTALVAGSLMSGASVSAKMNNKPANGSGFGQGQNWNKDKGYKNLNETKKNGAIMYSGTISSIDSGANSFVLHTNKADYAISTDATTKFMPALNGGTFGELVVGHKVSASGTLTGTTLAAKKVTDMTIMKSNNQAKMSFSGTVASGDSTNGWVLTTKKSGPIMVSPDANTKYYVITKGHKGKTAGTSADVMTGSKIQARGSWDGTNHILTKVLTITVTK